MVHGDVAAFLAARLDEDEAAAKAATQPHSWHPLDDSDSPYGRDQVHIARHDPAQVLREVAAKRAIAAEHGPAGFMAYGDHLCQRCAWQDDEPGRDDLHHWTIWPCLTLRALAAAWNDHPDYRQEWGVLAAGSVEGE